MLDGRGCSSEQRGIHRPETKATFVIHVPEEILRGKFGGPFCELAVGIMKVAKHQRVSTTRCRPKFYYRYQRTKRNTFGKWNSSSRDNGYLRNTRAGGNPSDSARCIG